MIRPLIQYEYEMINWNKEFQHPNMCRIRTEMDGSCFFHAISKAISKQYMEEGINNKPLDRYTFVRQLRKDLSKTLGEKMPNSDKTYYESISRGKLKEFSNYVPEYTLENMQKLLDSSKSIDNSYNEFISNVLDLDIYLLDPYTQDVYITGDDSDILYKGRKSIVILALKGHYELIGIKKYDHIQTSFDYNDEFIVYIRNRLKNHTVKSI